MGRKGNAWAAWARAKRRVDELEGKSPVDDEEALALILHGARLEAWTTEQVARAAWTEGFRRGKAGARAPRRPRTSTSSPDPRQLDLATLLPAEQP